jgi:hypothetical protein
LSIDKNNLKTIKIRICLILQPPIILSVVLSKYE